MNAVEANLLLQSKGSSLRPQRIEYLSFFHHRQTRQGDFVSFGNESKSGGLKFVRRIIHEKLERMGAQNRQTSRNI